MELTFILNGKKVWTEVQPNQMLSTVLREKFGLLGTKEGCGKGECGACTVLVDGKTVTSCIFPAAKAEGSQVLTIEGLAENGAVHPIQRAFMQTGAIQCGFCTPGMILSAKALLDRNPNPSEQEIRRGMSGNLCRCTGYVKIVEAVKLAASLLQEEKTV